MAYVAAFLACYFLISTVTARAFNAQNLVDVLDSRPGRSSQGQNCHQGWTYYDQFCYKYVNEYATFWSARSRCQVDGAYVVDIQNAGEAAFVLHTVVGRDNVRYWIGLTDEVVEDEWKWDRTGATANYTNWNSYWNQPGGGRKQNCVSTGFWDELKWSDMSCSERFRYVCKKAV